MDSWHCSILLYFEWAVPFFLCLCHFLLFCISTENPLHLVVTTSHCRSATSSKEQINKPVIISGLKNVPVLQDFLLQRFGLFDKRHIRKWESKQRAVIINVNRGSVQRICPITDSSATLTPAGRYVTAVHHATQTTHTHTHVKIGYFV